MKKITQKIFKVAWRLLEILYFPIYTASWILCKFARLLLGISCFGILESQKGKDILTNLFKKYGRY